MADLTGHPVGPVPQVPIKDDAPADPRAQGQAYQAVDLAARSPPFLTKRGGIRIIVQGYREVNGPLDQ